MSSREGLKLNLTIIRQKVRMIPTIETEALISEIMAP